MSFKEYLRVLPYAYTGVCYLLGRRLDVYESDINKHLVHRCRVYIK